MILILLDFTLSFSNCFLLPLDYSDLIPTAQTHIFSISPGSVSHTKKLNPQTHNHRQENMGPLWGYREEGQVDK